MRKLIAIDGANIMFRAYYGIRPLTTPAGEPCNAAFGFIKTVLMHIKDCDCATVAFDLPGKTFRDDMFDAYKAGRAETPNDLVSQIPMIHELMRLLNVPILTKEGYEADDILGTLSQMCEGTDTQCVIVSGDRDLLQLVSANTHVLLLGNNGNTLYTPDNIKSKYGIPATAIVDLKALMGDSSDNIPGVKGIGEKTGGSLIQQFGTLDNLYANLDSPNITKSVRQKLEVGKDSAYLSYKLAQINKHVPLDNDIDSLTRREPQQEIADYLKQLGFTSIIQSIGIHEPKPQEFALADTSATIARIKAAGKMYYQAADDGILIGTDESDVAIADRDLVLPLLVDDAIAKVGHNMKQDLHTFGGGIHNIAFDTQLAAYVVDCSDKLELPNLAAKYLGIDNPPTPLHTIIRLHSLLPQLLEQNEQNFLYYQMELPLLSVLYDMEVAGFPMCAEKLSQYGEFISREINELTEQIHALSGQNFNISSPKQLSEILFGALGLKPVKRTSSKSGYSTDNEVLEELKNSHPIIPLIIRHRTLTKLKGTYVDGLLPLIKDGRIHTTFTQTVTATGRLSSVNPNMQNIPIRSEEGRRIREAFIPQQGYTLIAADYSQIELRILAHMAGDAVMLQSFKSGVDIHAVTAANIFAVDIADVTSDMRRFAKTINFGIIYGMSEYGLSRDLDISFIEARHYIDSYFRAYKQVQQYMDATIAEAKECGYVKTLYNRRRYLPELFVSKTREQGIRYARNMPIQGTSADIIKLAMINVHATLRERGLRSRLVMQIHDELIIEAPLEEADQAKQILLHEMQSAAVLDADLLVEVK